MKNFPLTEIGKNPVDKEAVMLPLLDADLDSDSGTELTMGRHTGVFL